VSWEGSVVLTGECRLRVPENVVQYAMYGTRMEKEREYEKKWPDIDCNDYSVFSTNNLGDQIKVDEMGRACGT
jgi:hypothetical protein